LFSHTQEISIYTSSDDVIIAYKNITVLGGYSLTLQTENFISMQCSMIDPSSVRLFV